MTRCAESASPDRNGAKSLRFVVTNVPGENPAAAAPRAGLLVSKYNGTFSTTAPLECQTKKMSEAAGFKC